jgi:hypothetical protein
MSRATNGAVLKTEILQNWSVDNYINLFTSYNNRNTQLVNNLFIFFCLQNVLSKMNIKLINLKLFNKSTNYEIYPIVFGDLGSLMRNNLYGISKFLSRNKLVLAFNLTGNDLFKQLIIFFRYKWIFHKMFNPVYFVKKSSILLNNFYKKKKIFFYKISKKQDLNFVHSTHKYKKRVKKKIRLRYIFSFRAFWHNKKNRKHLSSKLVLFYLFNNFSKKNLKFIYLFVVKNFFNFLNFDNKKENYKNVTNFIKMVYNFILYIKLIKKHNKLNIFKNLRTFELRSFIKHKKTPLLKLLVKFLKKLNLKRKKIFHFKLNLIFFYRHVYFCYIHFFKQFINLNLVLLKYVFEIKLRYFIDKDITLKFYCLPSYLPQHLYAQSHVSSEKGENFILAKNCLVNFPLLKDYTYKLNFLLKYVWSYIKTKLTVISYRKGLKIVNFNYYLYYVLAGILIKNIRLFTFGMTKHLEYLRKHKIFLDIWPNFLDFLLNLLNRYSLHPIRGIKILLSGRINEVDLASSVNLIIGKSAQIHDVNSANDYCFMSYIARRGVYSLKVWFEY